MTAAARFPLYQWFRTEDHTPAPVPRPVCEPYLLVSERPTEEWTGDEWVPSTPELRIEDAEWDREFQTLEVFDAWPSAATVRAAVEDDGYARGRYTVVTADSDAPAFVLVVTSMSDSTDEI